MIALLMITAAFGGDRVLVGARTSVHAFDATTGADLGAAFTIPGTESVDIVETPRRTILVSNAQQSTNSVEERDPITGALVATLVTGSNATVNPFGLLVAPDRNAFYVADQAAGLQERDLLDGTLLRTFTPSTAGKVASGMTVGPDGHLYVAIRDLKQVWRFDRDTGARIDIPMSGYSQVPIDIVFDPAGNALVSTSIDGVVWKHTPNGSGGYTAGSQFTDLPAAGFAEGMAFGPDGHLYVIDRSNDVVVKVDGSTGAILDAAWASVAGWNLTERNDLQFLADTDGDGLIDAEDNCPGVSDLDQTDTDGDGFGDVCAHPSATIDPTVGHYGAYVGAKATIGAGVLIGQGTVIGRRADVGARTRIGTNTSVARAVAIGTRSVLGDGVAIGYGAAIGDRAVLGDGVRLANLATVTDDVVLGDGTRIGRGSTVTGSAIVGTDVIVGPGCTVVGGIAPQATLEDDVRMRRGSTVASGARVQSAATIGRDVTVGSGATIGTGAVIRAANHVTSDVGDHVVIPRGSFPGPGAWANPAYGYRQILDFTGGPGAGTGYVVRLDIGRDASVAGADLHLGGHASAFPTGEGLGGDLYFTSYDSQTDLPFWVERVDGGNRAVVWVRVSDDLGQDQAIQLYYGRPGAPDLADGEATFDLFDTFDGASLDPQKWTLNDPGDGVVSVSGGKLTMGIGGFQTGKFHGIHSLAEFPVGTQVTWRGQINDESGSNVRDGFGKQSVGIAFWTAWNQPGIHTFVSDIGVAAQWTPTGLSEAAPNNHRFTIQRLSDGTGRYFIDEIARTPPPSGSYSTVAPVQWQVYSGYDIVEVVFVSRVVDTEPALSGSRGEETP